MFLAKPTECLAHPVDILLTHPPTAKGYGVSPTESALPRPADPAPHPTQLNFLSLDESHRPQSVANAQMLQYLDSPALQGFGTCLTTRYARLNVRLALGSGTQVVESLVDLRLYLAKPLYPFSTSEVDVGLHATHENILGVIDVVSHENQVMSITEFCTRDLLSVAQYARPSPDQILAILRQLACGVRYLHLRGIAHRDLKLENIYLAGETPKITGFSCALIQTADSFPLNRERFGSTPYLAPEVHGEAPYDAYLADIWALGIILVGLSTGRFPWTCTRSDPSFARFEKDPRGYLRGLGLTEPELLLGLLVPDPRHRCDSATLLRSLDLPDPQIN